jgi:DNA (cytosine-5)-methyltransferase 1
VTFGSLFAGIGGMDLGLERAGMRCMWQVEINDYAKRVLARHWPDVRRWNDVRTFLADAHDDQCRKCSAWWGSPPCDHCGFYRWRVDLIAGGFPCQPVSHAGKRLAQQDERWLWPEFARVLRVLRPRFALLENVPGLFTAGFGDVLADLAALGFDAEWSVLSASSMGAPHQRARVFILAYSDGKHWPPRLGIQRDNEQTLRTCDLASIRSDWLETVTRNARGADGAPGEMERLISVGNAVVPQVAEWIGRRIMEHEIARGITREGGQR